MTTAHAARCVFAALAAANAFSSPAAVPAHCTFVSVGGGWAGIYAAWRVAVDSKLQPASETCIFEASSRWGGRTFTVRSGATAASGESRSDGKDLNIDIGAYRFAFEQRLPSDLIRGPLSLPTECYIPSCQREPLDGNLVLHKLVDPSTNSSAGYGAALDAMLLALRRAGAHLFLQTELVAVRGGDGNKVLLEWRGGAHTVATNVLLNLPRHAIHALDSSSVLFTEATPLARSLYDCSRESAVANYTAEASVKVYLLYPDAWWRTRLGLVEGELHSVSDPPLYIRYHDGPTRCNGNFGIDNQHKPQACAGALLVQYAHTLEAGGGFYMRFRRNTSTPLTVLPYGDSPLPELLHRKLLAVHTKALRAAGIAPGSLPTPKSAYLGFWPHDPTELFHPAPDPLSFSTAHGPLPRCLGGLTSVQYSAATRKPVPGRSIFIANNDWWLEESEVDLIAPYWAEVSLRVAERVLHDHVGLPQPGWLDARYFRRSVLGI